MQRSEFETCMMAVAECRELIQSVKADLDQYICMKREQSKEENKLVAAAVTEGINMVMATMNPEGAVNTNTLAGVDVTNLGGAEAGRINLHELNETPKDVVNKETGETAMTPNTTGEKEIAGIDPSLLSDEEDNDEEEA